METNKLLNALENESNASIMDLTTSKVKCQKNNCFNNYNFQEKS